MSGFVDATKDFNECSYVRISREGIFIDEKLFDRLVLRIKYDATNCWDIIEFTSRVIEASVTELGGKPLRLGRIPDDIDKLREAVSSASGKADIVVIIAGASAGT